jgi:myo-inositol-1(or 4)-monophosphatase
VNFQRELAVAVHAARAAGGIVRAHYDGRVESWEKSADNPVTHADLEANQKIHATVLEAFPGDGWLSEETADSTERLGKSRVWIVDPLDGTKEFIQRIPEFCICVGLTVDGKAVLGAEYNPATDELFAGIVGEGATYNGAAARVSAVRELLRARVLASRSEDKRGEWDDYKDQVQVVLTGSVAFKLALISAGKADATFSLTPKNEWDICAGAALIEAAGGRVTALDGQPLRFNQPQTKLPGLIASNGVLHGPLQRMIAATRGTSESAG